METTGKLTNKELKIQTGLKAANQSLEKLEKAYNAIEQSHKTGNRKLRRDMKYKRGIFKKAKKKAK